MKKSELIKSWIHLQTLDQDSEEAGDLMWASDDVLDLSMSSPLECWKFILEVILQTDDEWVLTNLAAGPLENLLAMNGDEAIILIEKEIPHNAKLKSLLQGVWKNLISDSVWDHLQSLK